MFQFESVRGEEFERFETIQLVYVWVLEGHFWMRVLEEEVDLSRVNGFSEVRIYAGGSYLT